MVDKPQWLRWAQELQGIAQAGLAYSKDPYDLERFERVRTLACDMVQRYTQLPEETVRSLFAAEDGYQTPKVDVRAAVVQGGKILLVQERLDGRWSLPGGWAEPGLTLRQNLQKEVWEEAGLRVEPTRLVAVHDRSVRNQPDVPHTVYKCFALCQPLDGVFAPNLETMDCGFFTMEDLPELSTGRVVREQLELCVKAAAQPDFLPQFD